MKDLTPLNKNYAVKIPKEEIAVMVKKEIGKNFPDFLEMVRLRKKIIRIEERLENLEIDVIEKDIRK